MADEFEFFVEDEAESVGEEAQASHSLDAPPFEAVSPDAGEHAELREGGTVMPLPGAVEPDVSIPRREETLSEEMVVVCDDDDDDEGLWLEVHADLSRDPAAHTDDEDAHESPSPDRRPADAPAAECEGSSLPRCDSAPRVDQSRDTSEPRFEGDAELDIFDAVERGVDALEQRLAGPAEARRRQADGAPGGSAGSGSGSARSSLSASPTPTPTPTPAQQQQRGGPAAAPAPPVQQAAAPQPASVARRLLQGVTNVWPQRLHDNLQSMLKPHQVEGIDFMWGNVFGKKRGCVLAHAMGLGKTCQIVLLLLAFVKQRAVEGLTTRAVVVVPKPVVATWRLEFAKWYSFEEKDVIAGLGLQRIHLYTTEETEAARLAALRLWHAEGGILLTTYTRLKEEVSLINIDKQNCLDGAEALPERAELNENMLFRGASIIVADEVQMAKNPDTQVARTLAAFSTQLRVAVTGTPLENKAQDLLSIIDFALPDRFNLEEIQRWCKGIEGSATQRADTCRIRESEMQARVVTEKFKEVLHRRDDSILRAALPPLTEYLVKLRLSPLQQALWKEYIKQGAPQSATGRNDLFEMRAVCSRTSLHPAALHAHSLEVPERYAWLQQAGLLQEGQATDPKGCSSEWEALSPKLQAVRTIVSQAVLGGEKVLIFSQFKESLQFVHAYLQRADPRTSIELLTGEDKEGERAAKLKAMHNHQTDVLLLTFGVGSVGLTITTATRVVLLENSWNPAQMKQAVFRAYRYGQTRPVFVYRLVAEGTMERTVFKDALRKEWIQQRLVEGTTLERRNLQERSKAEYYIYEQDRKEPVDPTLRRGDLTVDALAGLSSLVQAVTMDSLLQIERQSYLATEQQLLSARRSFEMDSGWNTGGMHGFTDTTAMLLGARGNDGRRRGRGRGSGMTGMPMPGGNGTGTGAGYPALGDRRMDRMELLKLRASEIREQEAADKTRTLEAKRRRLQGQSPIPDSNTAAQSAARPAGAPADAPAAASTAPQAAAAQKQRRPTRRTATLEQAEMHVAPEDDGLALEEFLERSDRLRALCEGSPVLLRLLKKVGMVLQQVPLVTSSSVLLHGMALPSLHEHHGPAIDNCLYAMVSAGAEAVVMHLEALQCSEGVLQECLRTPQFYEKVEEAAVRFFPANEMLLCLKMMAEGPGSERYNPKMLQFSLKPAIHWALEVESSSELYERIMHSASWKDMMPVWLRQMVALSLVQTGVMPEQLEAFQLCRGVQRLLQRYVDRAGPGALPALRCFANQLAAVKGVQYKDFSQTAGGVSKDVAHLLVYERLQGDESMQRGFPPRPQPQPQPHQHQHQYHQHQHHQHQHQHQHYQHHQHHQHHQHQHYQHHQHHQHQHHQHQRQRQHQGVPPGLAPQQHQAARHPVPQHQQQQQQQQRRVRDPPQRQRTVYVSDGQQGYQHPTRSGQRSSGHQGHSRS